MNRFAIIGLGSFGRSILDDLIELKINLDIIIIDKNAELIDMYKSEVSDAIIANIIDEKMIFEILPKNIDCVVIDFADKTETSILVTSYIKKFGVKRIVAKAENIAHAEILKIAGATEIVFPNREASKRIIPTLITSNLLQFMPIGRGLVFAEMETPSDLYGKKIVQVDIRKKYNINIIAIRNKDETSDYFQLTPDHLFSNEDVLLISGKEKDVLQYSSSAKIAKDDDKDGDGGDNFFKSLKNYLSFKKK